MPKVLQKNPASELIEYRCSISKYFLCIKSCFLYKVDFFFKAQNLSKKNQVPIYEFLVIRGETQGQFVFSVKKTEICPDFLFRSLTDQISNETLLTNNPFFFSNLSAVQKIITLKILNFVGINLLVFFCYRLEIQGSFQK